MECAPPLNLSTTIKVEDSHTVIQEEKTEEFIVEGEVVKETTTPRDEEHNTDEEEEEEEANNQEFENDQNSERDSKIEFITPVTVIPGSSSYLDTKENSYKCSECPAEFVRASLLRAHQRSHYEEQTYECDQCDEIFARIGLLTTHQRKHHKNSFACNECDLKFTHYNSYKIHQRKHKGDKPHKCKDCNMAFVQPCHLNIHRRIHTGEKPYKCEVCPQRFKQASHLTTHMRVHTNDKPFACTLCEASFSQTSSLKRHKRRHTGEKPFKCDECGALFVERRNLSRHQLTHTGEKPYKCDKCTSSFTQMIDLKRHQMSHSGLKPFKCDICDAAFSRKNNLRWHKLTHEGDTPYKCERCNVGFSLARDMKTHMRTHSGSMPFNCDQCGAAFNQVSTLKRHMQSHTGERPFVCPKCHGAFKDKSALKRHMLRHESVRPFSCHKCDSTFIEFRNLKRHRVTVHGEERFDGADGVNEREINQDYSLQPPKKITDKHEEDENTMGSTYNSSYSETPLVQHQEPTEQNDDPHISIEPSPPLSQNQQQPHATESVPSTVQPPVVNEIVNFPSQAPGHLPTLLLTQPGQPPKAARPANNCQNHQSHVLTFVEGCYNHWQSWCFCETPNIPENQQSIMENTNNVGAQPLSSALTPEALVEHQTLSYTELQPQPQPQSIGVQEVNQTDYHNSTQFNGNYPEPIHHYDDNHHTDKLDSMSHHHHHSSNNQSQQLHQPHSTHEVKISIDPPRLFAPSDVNKNSTDQQEHQQHQQKQQKPHNNQEVKTAMPSPKLFLPDNDKNTEEQGQQQQSQTQLQQHHNQLSQHSQDQHQHLQQQQHQHHQQHHQHQQEQQLRPHTEKQNNSDHSVQQPDPQVTFQYSLTVNNPATGDIQIQSEAFPANPSDPSVDPPNKKRRLTKTSESQEGKSYHCESCPKTFSRINHLLIHQRTHTGEKPYQCGVCFQSFTHKNSLTIHMRGHTGERPYVCGTCGASFTQKSNLRVHSRTHTGEKPFKCDVCSLAFTQGSHLTAHKRIHNNDRPFACDKCHQTFTQRSALKRHLMTHTGHKPHKCENCNARFAQKDDLRRHQRVHHSEKTLTCTYKGCTLLFTDRAAHIKHVRTVHQGKPDQPSDGIKKKKKKPVNKKSASDDNTNSKTSKIKIEVLNPEPTRTSKRLREAAEKKREKTENSDFIIGDFVEIEDDKMLIVQQKSPKKLETDLISETKNKMESWCFCEVPHGPDEPHTHSNIDAKLRKEEPESILPDISEAINQGPTSVIATADVTGATSLLQLSMEQVTHSSTTSAPMDANMHLQTANSNVPISSVASMNGTTQVGETPVIGEASSHQAHVMSVRQTNPSVSQSLTSGQVITAITQPAVSSQNNGRLINQSMVTANQVVSTGQLVGTGQLMTQDGAIFIEAGEMLSNGTVVINPGQGTYVSYDQITISSDGQVLGVPVGSAGAETFMIQPAPVSVDPLASSTSGSYSAATPVQENSTQPIQYTPLSGEVINIFPQVETSKESSSSEPNEKTLHVIAKPLDCTVCAKAFAQKRTLWAHMQESHPDLFSCPECCAAFTTSEFLIQHKAQHQKVYVCSKCGLAFTNKSSLSRHRQQMHTGTSVAADERVCACEICDARFHQQSDLRRHMLGHTGEKPYKCTHCEAGFTRTSSLNKHMRIHTGEKPYVCEDCDQAFSYKYQFNRHRASHRQEEEKSSYSMPYVLAD